MDVTVSLLSLLSESARYQYATNTILFNSHQILPLAGSPSPSPARDDSKENGVTWLTRPKIQEKNSRYFCSVKEHPVVGTYPSPYFPIPRQTELVLPQVPKETL